MVDTFPAVGSTDWAAYAQSLHTDVVNHGTSIASLNSSRTTTTTTVNSHTTTLNQLGNRVTTLENTPTSSGGVTQAQVDSTVAAAVADKVTQAQVTTSVNAGIANKVVYVNHGSTASTARPSGAAMVIWYGSVTPTNMAAQDLYNAPA